VKHLHEQRDEEIFVNVVILPVHRLDVDEFGERLIPF
jgi:hypothetical protein